MSKRSSKKQQHSPQPKSGKSRICWQGKVTCSYIVSGLERSGTSMMMQVLEAGGVRVASDGSRPADYHNPRGYYELAGGKIIRELMAGTFPFEGYRGMFIKVTAYGLRFLPEGSYKILYMLRDVDEILDSEEKMAGAIDRSRERELLKRLNEVSVALMESRADIEHLEVWHRAMIQEPDVEIRRVSQFVGGMDVEAAIRAVDPKLYRNRRD